MVEIKTEIDAGDRNVLAAYDNGTLICRAEFLPNSNAAAGAAWRFIEYEIRKYAIKKAAPPYMAVQKL